MLTTVLTAAGSALAVLTAVLSYGMSRKAHTLSTRTAEQTGRRGRSEETMRLLRWAVELASEPDDRRREAGVVALQALKDAQLVIAGDRAFVHAVAEAVMAAWFEEAPYSETDDVRIAAPNEGESHG